MGFQPLCIGRMPMPLGDKGLDYRSCSSKLIRRLKTVHTRGSKRVTVPSQERSSPVFCRSPNSLAAPEASRYHVALGIVTVVVAVVDDMTQ
jgi:hypothetical protein